MGGLVVFVSGKVSQPSSSDRHGANVGDTLEDVGVCQTWSNPRHVLSTATPPYLIRANFHERGRAAADFFRPVAYDTH